MTPMDTKLQSARIALSGEAAEYGSKLSHILVGAVRTLEGGAGSKIILSADDSAEVATKLARIDLVMRSALKFDLDHAPLWLQIDGSNQSNIDILVAATVIPGSDDVCFICRRIYNGQKGEHVFLSPNVTMWQRSAMSGQTRVQDVATVRHAASYSILSSATHGASIRVGRAIASLVMGVMAKTVNDMALSKMNLLPTNIVDPIPDIRGQFCYQGAQ